MKGPQHKIDSEYNILRGELSESKKYVFERPILIITASFALAQLNDKQYELYAPIILIGLLYFNLLFTYKRLGSMARIVAYIQVVIEERTCPWIGWETSLRRYRCWLKVKKTKVRLVEIDDTTHYDNLSYYTEIFLMHIAVTIVAFTFSVKFYFDHPTTADQIACFITAAFLIAFLVFAFSIIPQKARRLIEQNRIVWISAFGDNLTNVENQV